MIGAFARDLIIAFVTLMVAVVAAIVLVGFGAAANTLKRHAQLEVDIAQRVFEQQLRDNVAQLAQRAEVLASDFGFRSAIATRERETVASVLINHGERVGADMMFALAPSGDVFVSSHDLPDSADMVRQTSVARTQSAPPASNLIRRQESREQMMVVEDKLYQVVTLPIMAPDLVGWVGIGFHLDQSVLERLSQTVLADLTLLCEGKHTLVMASTLPAQITTSWEEAIHDSTIAAVAGFLADQGMLTRSLSLVESPDMDVSVLLSVPLEEQFTQFHPLRNTIAAIIVIAMIAAFITAIIIARRLTRPITLLSAAADRMASGNYDEPVRVRTETELANLADAFNTMQEEVKQREELIRLQANFDMLTRLPNKIYFAELIEKNSVSAPLGTSARFGIVVLKIVNLEALIDAYGGAWVDAMLPLIAERLLQLRRRGDHIGRVGGDKFALYCDELDRSGIMPIAEKLFECLDTPFRVDDIEVSVNFRMGVVLAPEHGNEFIELMRRANVALSGLVHSGERVGVYEAGQDEQHRRQILITNRLQHALHQNVGLFLTYQPKLNVQTGEVRQVEALLRWHDAELGAVFPDEFIPVAENSGIILALTEWVLRESVKQVVAWRAEGITLAIAVNLSAYDFLQEGFVELLHGIVTEGGVTPSDIVLEITEGATIRDIDKAIAYMTHFRRLGYEISMDDFGTGYSSLSHLKRLPLDELKIDRSFLMHIDTDEDDRKIVRSTITLAHDLGLRVVAEGVENAESFALLEEMKCDKVQGYYLTRPLPAEAFTTWYRENQYDEQA